MSSISEEDDQSESAQWRAPPLRAAANPRDIESPETKPYLNLYGRMGRDGEWRNYAIDFLRTARCSGVRRASEAPIYRTEKDPRLARKQGMYSVNTATGRDPAPWPTSSNACCW